MTEETRIDPRKEERDAIARIALTNDGRLLHRYLRRILESRSAAESHGALYRQEGGRILAGDLMSHMAPGIENRAGSSDTTDAAILSRPASGVAVIAPSARRRGAALAPGDGWQPEPDDTAADSGTT